MSLNVSNLTKYVDETSQELIRQSIVTGTTIDLVRVIPGVKNSININAIGGPITGQAGACGWSPAGTTILTKENILVNDIKINEAICLNDLEDYYTSTMMRPGSYNEDMPFEQIYSEMRRDQIKELNEKLIWQGDVDGTPGTQMVLTDGWLKYLTAGVTASSPYYGSYTASTATANILTIVEDAIAKLPENIMDADDLTLFVPYTYFRAYTNAIRKLYPYPVDASNATPWEMTIFGENIKIKGTKGLTGKNNMVLTRASNLVVGTDLLNDAEAFRIFYSQDNDEVRFIAKWKLGVKYEFLNEIVFMEGV